VRTRTTIVLESSDTFGKFQNKWGPVRYDAAGTTGQRKIWWLGLSNIADASVSQMWNTYFYSRLNFYDA